ncbi:Tyrosine-protein kinase RYK [Frankliniella fusca]|uniref:Tyrosine-protein kinase RYK n=1 Tax=Frankliniella fusca TaxID=407009 RepID=A0AAE1LLR7_9NEOP|nr:Tyrosine-protein kinase RYK [Frankliniella fusca]
MKNSRGFGASQRSQVHHKRRGERDCASGDAATPYWKSKRSNFTLSTKSTNCDFSPLSVPVQVLYQFRMEVGDKEAMDPPTLDIPPRGRLPDFVETFKVHLPCTGRKAAEVDVLIQLNITTNTKKHNDTVLNFMRKKICLLDDRPRTPHPNEVGPPSAGATGAAGADAAAGGAGGGDGWRPVLLEATEGLYATGGIAGALFVLSSFLMVLVWKRRSTSKMRPQECQYTSYASAYGSPPSVLVSKPPLPGSGRGALGPFIGAVNSDSDCGSYATIASFHKVGLGSALGLGSVLGSALGGSSVLGGSASRVLGPSSLASGSLTKSSPRAASPYAASPYATSVVATSGGGSAGGGGGGASVVTRLYSPTPALATPQTESAYSSYSSYCPRRVAYYAASSVNSFGKPSAWRLRRELSSEGD